MNERREKVAKDLPRLNYGVLLDNLKDSANIGTIIRTCHAFGCGEIILYGYEYLNRKSQTTSRNLYRWENISFFQEKKSLIQYIDSSDYDLVVVDTCPESKSLSCFDFPKKPLFVFGHESLGVEEFLKENNVMIYIPQIGTTKTINVSNAASIILYHFFQQTWKNHSRIEDWNCSYSPSKGKVIRFLP